MRIAILLAALSITTASITTTVLAADDVTYRKNIRPLWEQKCMPCHGKDSPYLAEFEENKEKFRTRMRGPRMDTYADLVAFVGWPDTGAVMRLSSPICSNCAMKSRRSLYSISRAFPRPRGDS